MTAAISSFTAPPLPQANVQPPAAQPPHHDFAQMLSQRQAQAHEAVHAAPEPHVAHDAAAQPQRAAQRPAATPPPGEHAATKTGKATAAKTPEPTEREDQASAATDKSAEADDAEPADAIDPALADWMAALNLPAAPVPTDDAVAKGRGAAKAGAELTGDAAEVKGAKGKPGVAALQGDAAAAGTSRSDTEPAERLHTTRESREKPDAVAADASASSWQAAMERVAPAEVMHRHETPGVAALSAAHAAAGPHRAGDAAAPVAVSMPTPATAPEFAQSLGMQVSVLARDGIQTAELHLNPADMGPISVQIALEGTQAQVNFGADSAATRQIIEGGLPELAAALRDAGFTLSGGGVHSQARGRGEGDGPNGGDGSGRGGASSETEVTPRRVTARVSAGGVDLYA